MANNMSGFPGVFGVSQLLVKIMCVITGYLKIVTYNFLRH